MQVGEHDFEDTGDQTEVLYRPAIFAQRQIDLPRYTLRVRDGEQEDLSWTAKGERCSIGSHPSNDLVLSDKTVSRFHCELAATPRGIRIRDLESKNGTSVNDVAIESAWLAKGAQIRLGNVTLAFELGTERVSVPLVEQQRFGDLVGGSTSMRRAFHVMERCAQSDVTVLIIGETGTGKEGAAAAIHKHSVRKDGPFVIVDCSAIPSNLFESELFGHEKGSFTGAAARRIGAFEKAHGGTIFLDEVGELPSDLQPKLLRVLERRTFRRIGQNDHRPVDVRVIAATNRDLRAQVNEGYFRSDLYFRLAVMKVQLPPLRERREDLPLLVEALLRQLDATPEQIRQFASTAFLDRVRLGTWSGNVRELRNYLESCLVMGEEMPILQGEPAAARAGEPGGQFRVDLDVPLLEAKNQVVADFEIEYIRELLRAHRGRMAPAARAAGIDRAYLYRLIKKYDIDRDEPEA